MILTEALLNDARDRRVLLQREVSPRFIIVSGVGSNDATQVRFAEHRLWSMHSRRIEPISRSTCPFCQGERAAVGRLRVPIARTRRMKA